MFNVLVESVRAEYGQSCSKDSDCYYRNAACDNGKCLCSPNYDFRSKSEGCVHTELKGLNDPCSMDEECNGYTRGNGYAAGLKKTLFTIKWGTKKSIRLSFDL